MKNKKFLVTLIFFVVSGLSFLFYWSFRQRFYDERVVECKPEDVVVLCEERFLIDIPDSAAEIRAAQSRSIDGSVKFILKLQIDEKGFDEFASSFSDGIVFSPYHRSKDYRAKDLSPVPKWFLSQIKNGEIGTYGSAYGSFFILVDKTDKNAFSVYLHGHY